MVYGDWKLHKVIACARHSTVPVAFPSLLLVAKTVDYSLECTTTWFACTHIDTLEATKVVAKLAVRGSLAVFASERAHVHRCDAKPHGVGSLLLKPIFIVRVILRFVER